MVMVWGGRYVDPVRPLQPYQWSEAAGRALLAQLHDGAYLPHGFLGCVPLASRLSFIVATCRWAAGNVIFPPLYLASSQQLSIWDVAVSNGFA